MYAFVTLSEVNIANTYRLRGFLRSISKVGTFATYCSILKLKTKSGCLLG
jgi:hypothetical protein